MKLVIDSNCLRHASLTAYMRSSPVNRAVLVDYAALEALKGDPVVGLYESLKIVAEFPSQVQILKTTKTICGLSGASAGLQRRLVDVPRTAEFSSFCAALLAARKHDAQEPIASLLKLGNEARAQLLLMENEALAFAAASVEIARKFTQGEQEKIRLCHRYSGSLLDKLLELTMALNIMVFSTHPAIRRAPLANEIINTYLFRSSLCHFLLGFDYASVGGVAGKSSARVRNDMVDTLFATYATFFDGILSNDERTNWLYACTRDVLARFHITYLQGAR